MNVVESDILSIIIRIHIWSALGTVITMSCFGLKWIHMWQLVRCVQYNHLSNKSIHSGFRKSFHIQNSHSNTHTWKSLSTLHHIILKSSVNDRAINCNMPVGCNEHFIWSRFRKMRVEFLCRFVHTYYILTDADVLIFRSTLTVHKALCLIKSQMCEQHTRLWRSIWNRSP